jgi:hypothetical protein
VLDSLFLALTATALVLLVPASLALRRTGRHARVAEPAGSTRRVRVVAAAGLLGLAALGVSALIGSGPAPAVVVAGVVAGTVGLNYRLHRSWAVRGLVAWTLVVLAGVGLASWLLHRTLLSPASAPALMTAGLAWLVLLYGLVSLRTPIRRRIEVLAVRDAGATPERAGLRGPMVRAAAALVAAGLVATVTAPGLPSEPDRAPSQAGRTSTPQPTDSPWPSTTPTEGARATSPSGTTRSSAGSRGSPDSPDGPEVAETTAVPTSTTGVPTSSAPPSTAEATSTADPVQATKTPGYIKNSAKRPSGVPLPSPGGPSQP